MNAYDQLLKFLQENEGRKMNVGIHAYNLASYITFENWSINSDTDEIEIVNQQNTVTVINGDNVEIKGFTIVSEKMNVFPDGNFELYTEHGTICFELL